MTPGYQSVQAAHAAIDFVFEHPDRAGPWHKNSQYLVLLSVRGEPELKDLILKVRDRDLKFTFFREPDIGDQITAIAIEPSPVTQKLVRNLPLLLKDKTITQ